MTLSDFDKTTDTPKISNTPDKLTPKQISKYAKIMFKTHHRIHKHNIPLKPEMIKYIHYIYYHDTTTPILLKKDIFLMTKTSW